MQKSDDILLTVAQAADRLNCSRKQLRDYIDNGKLACVRTGTTRRSDRVRRSEVDKFILESGESLE